MIALKCATFRRKKSSAPTARDYVQDGLVTMWDGIENAGWGVHDESATVWKDLVGVNDLVMGTNTFSSDHAVCTVRMNAKALAQYIGTGKESTVEYVVMFPDDSYKDTGGVLMVDYQIINNWITNNDRYTVYGFFNGNPYVNISLNTRFSSSVSCGDIDASGVNLPIVYSNGEFVRSATRATSIRNATNFWVGQGHYGGNGRNNIHSVRIYSRALTAEEIAANYAVDKARFNIA